MLPWMTEVFPHEWWDDSTDTSSAKGQSAGHYKDLTKTGNCAWKVSDTQPMAKLHR